MRLGLAKHGRYGQSCVDTHADLEYLATLEYGTFDVVLQLDSEIRNAHRVMSVQQSLVDLLLDRLEATTSHECPTYGLDLEQAVLVAKLVEHVEDLIKLLNEVSRRVRLHDLVEFINLNLNNSHFALIVREVLLTLLDLVADHGRYENIKNLLEFKVGAYFAMAIDKLLFLLEFLYVHIG